MLPRNTWPGLLLGSKASSPDGRGTGSVRSDDWATPRPSMLGMYLQRFLRLPLISTMRQRLTSRSCMRRRFFFLSSFFDDFLLFFSPLEDLDLASADTGAPTKARVRARTRNRTGSHPNLLLV